MVWKFETGARIDAAPLTVDGTVYVGSQDAHLYALDAADGALLWKYYAGAGIAADPAAAGGAVIAADLDGRLRAVDMSSGTLRWTTEPTSQIWGKVSTDGASVFAANKDGAVMAFSAEDGAPVWTHETDGAIYGGTNLVGKSAMVASYDDWVYSLDAESGELEWKTEILQGARDAPLFAGGIVAVGSYDERLYAMNAASGANVWNFWSGGAIVRGAAASEDAVFFGSGDGYAYSVSAEDGSLNWRRKIGEQVRSKPAVGGGVLYIASGDTVFALDAANGAEVWSLTAGGEVVSPLAVSGGAVYAGAEDGNLYALAAGFPDGYSPPISAAAPPAPAFVPLSPDELKDKLDEAFGSNAKVVGEAATFTANSRTVFWRDASDLIEEVFENGYYLLTGRTAREDGWEARYLPREEYERLADERGSPSLKKAAGWCCVRTDEGLRMVMRGYQSQNAAVGVTAHEAGHALQALLNPAQSKAPVASLASAMIEAQAHAFAVALLRKIGESVGAEVSKAPDGYRWSGYISGVSDDLRESVSDLSKVHARGHLIIWQALLNDSDLAHMRRELAQDGQLSADSLLEMYYKFVGLTPSEVAPYIETISSDNLSDDLNFMRGTVSKRVGFAGIAYPDFVLNNLALMLFP